MLRELLIAMMDYGTGLVLRNGLAVTIIFAVNAHLAFHRRASPSSGFWASETLPHGLLATRTLVLEAEPRTQRNSFFD
jgi:hypothetical protein